MTSWSECCVGKKVIASLIDRLTREVADGSVGTEKIKIWVGDDTFFFSLWFFFAYVPKEFKENQSSKTTLNKFKSAEGEASSFPICCVWEVLWVCRNYEMIECTVMTNRDILSVEEHNNLKSFVACEITCLSVLYLWRDAFAYSLTSKFTGLMSWSNRNLKISMRLGFISCVISFCGSF